MADRWHGVVAVLASGVSASVLLEDRPRRCSLGQMGGFTIVAGELEIA